MGDRSTAEVARMAARMGADAVEVAHPDEETNARLVREVKQALPHLPVLLGGHTNHENIARRLAEAEKPLIITTASGAAAMAPLGRIAEKYALPVVTQRQRVVCLPSSHPMHMGYDPQGLLQEADLVIVMDADVPWIPNEQTPHKDARFVTLGEDPAFRRYPMRSFPSDLAITSKTSPRR